MSVFEIIIAGMVWIIVGMIVAETARIWFGMWWLTMHPITILFWPFVILSALFGKHHG